MRHVLPVLCTVVPAKQNPHNLILNHVNPWAWDD